MCFTRQKLAEGSLLRRHQEGWTREERDSAKTTIKRLCKPEVMSNANYDSCSPFKKKLSADEAGQKLALKVIHQSVASF